MATDPIPALVERAMEVRKHAYAPYSKFFVGAALLTEEGSVFVGCNVENASSGATVCAESNAVAAAVASGSKKFKAIAVVGGFETDFTYPCGICLQKLREFAPDLEVHLATPKGKTRQHKLSELFPFPFGR